MEVRGHLYLKSEICIDKGGKGENLRAHLRLSNLRVTKYKDPRKCFPNIIILQTPILSYLITFQTNYALQFICFAYHNLKSNQWIKRPACCDSSKKKWKIKEKRKCLGWMFNVQREKIKLMQIRR